MGKIKIENSIIFKSMNIPDYLMHETRYTRKFNSTEGIFTFEFFKDGDIIDESLIDLLKNDKSILMVTASIYCKKHTDWTESI